MKAKFLLIVVLLFFQGINNGCGNHKKDSLNVPECAIIMERSCFNRNNGTATLTLVVPKGFSLEMKTDKNNIVHFFSRGSGTPLNDTIEKTVGGLNSKLDSLFVFLKINNQDENGQNVFIDKKKGSVIAGEPFMPCNDDGSPGSIGRCIEYRD